MARRKDLYLEGGRAQGLREAATIAEHFDGRYAGANWSTLQAVAIALRAAAEEVERGM